MASDSKKIRIHRKYCDNVTPKNGQLFEARRNCYLHIFSEYKLKFNNYTIPYTTTHDDLVTMSAEKTELFTGLSRRISLFLSNSSTSPKLFQSLILKKTVLPKTIFPWLFKWPKYLPQRSDSLILSRERPLS